MSAAGLPCWRRVLVAARDAETLAPLLQRALPLVEGEPDRLTALLVLPELGDLERVARFAQRPVATLAAERIEEARGALGERLLALGLGARPELEVRSGELFLEALRLVEAGAFDLLLKAAERRPSSRVTRLAEAFRASTDQHLLRKCPAPVWLVEGEAADPPRRILAAVDVDAEAASEPDTLRALNARICEQLTRLAGLGAEEIVLAHAWDAPGEGMLRRCMPADQLEAALASYLDEVEGGRRRALEALAEALRSAVHGQAPDCSVRIRMLRGSARSVVPELVRRDRPDLLILGTVGRAGVRGLLIGNTAEDVLNDVEGSLFAVKPPGFVCPIEL